MWSWNKHLWAGKATEEEATALASLSAHSVTTSCRPEVNISDPLFRSTMICPAVTSVHTKSLKDCYSSFHKQQLSSASLMPIYGTEMPTLDPALCLVFLSMRNCTRTTTTFIQCTFEINKTYFQVQHFIIHASLPLKGLIIHYIIQNTQICSMAAPAHLHIETVKLVNLFHPSLILLWIKNWTFTMWHHLVFIGSVIYTDKKKTNMLPNNKMVPHIQATLIIVVNMLKC